MFQALSLLYYCISIFLQWHLCSAAGRRTQSNSEGSILMDSSILSQVNSILESGGKGAYNRTGKGKSSGKGGKKGKGYSTSSAPSGCNSSSYNSSKGSKGYNHSKGKSKGYTDTPSPSVPCPSSSSPTPTEPTTETPSKSPTASPSISFSPTTNSPTTSNQPSSYDCTSPSGRRRDISIIFSTIVESLVPGTPQADAYDWIVNVDESDACDGPTDLMERYLLTVFYYSTGGDNWKNKRGWLLGSVHHCANGWTGITCGADNHVDQIKLQKNNLSGEIPSDIAGLTSLSNIRLFDNNLYGTIPSEIYDLQYLYFMDLEQNQLSGDLFTPDLYKAAPTLTKFRMSDNQFVGSIPTEIGTFTNLEELWSASNALEGSIPTEITALTSMESLIVYNNDFSGVIPSNIGLMANLNWIDISMTNVTGAVPQSIGNLEKLRILILQSMQLTGELPPTMSNLINLEQLLAQENEFVGPIPDFSACYALEKLVLLRNSLTGPLPDMGPNLVFLDVRENELSGTIPESLFTLNQDTIQTIYLTNNTFSGPIPASYGKASSLSDLWLNGNDLTGTIPDIEEGDLPSITEILFNENRLNGKVPDGICNLIAEIPDQFFSLHADCYPRPGTDVPNNECACCTDCSVGKTN